MKKRVWAMLCAMMSGVGVPTLANAAEINLAPQPLGAALQDLARQSGAQIIFFSNVVEGRRARALVGPFTPEAAVAALLEGTDLTYHVLNERTIEVAARSVAAAASPQRSEPSQPLDEIEINARREKLSVMRAELQKLEEQFYAEYNELNTDPQYDIICSSQARTHTRTTRQVCDPAFARNAARQEAARATRCASPALLIVLMKTPDYQKNMADVVEHPRLLELLKTRYELVQRYQAFQRRDSQGDTKDTEVTQLNPPRSSSRAVAAAVAATSPGCTPEARALEKLPTDEWAIAKGLEPVRIDGKQYFCAPRPAGSDAKRNLANCATLGDLRRARAPAALPTFPGFPYDTSSTVPPAQVSADSPEMNPMLQR